MLDESRKYYVTASQAHRVMAGFETELAGKNAIKPEIETFDAIASEYNKLGVAPKVGDLKKLGVTASGAEIQECVKYLKSQVKVFSEGMESVSLMIAMSEFISNIDEGYKSVDMERGDIQEVEAVEYLQEITGKTFTKAGDDQAFLTKGNLGVTPDGVENDGFVIKSCAEVKNPKDTTHMKYLYLIKDQETLLKYAPNYYWQAQCGLYVTDAECYHWLSYHNEFTKHGDKRGVYVRVEPNQEHIDMLIERADRVLNKVPEIIESILNKV